MSTQRRENRFIPATKTSRRGPRCRWRHTTRTAHAAATGNSIPGPLARFGSADAHGGTAPPVFLDCFRPSDENLSPGTAERLATNSLLSDCRIVQLVQMFCLELRPASPPPAAGLGLRRTPATHGSSLPHIPFSFHRARLHPTLSRVPAGRVRWAERYDGKGNMHLQHAA
jgi:hypothetical protein